MNHLYFLVAWNKNKEKTWSGTCWGLFKALKKYFSVEDIDINLSKFENLVGKIKRRLFHRDNLFGLNDILKQRKKVRKILNTDKKSIVFQFAEVVSNASNVDSYIYIDEDVNHVKYLYENEPEVYNKSNFVNTNIKSINKRNDSQAAYFANCSGIFTMGHWLKKSIVERLNISPDLVHNVGGGINLDVSKIKEGKRTHNKILFVGRDFERKGGHLVVEAFIQLKKQRPNIELHIAGPSHNPVNDNIENIYFYGDCNRNDIADLMNKCDIFCMPSYFEAYGLVFIEALVFGLPCIGRNAYEMPYFIENEKTGLLIDDDNVDELARKISILLDDNSYSVRVKEKRNWYIKEYSWDTVACKIYNVINGN
jgi:glycosyltransferase involved in cell wall biosynthesis